MIEKIDIEEIQKEKSIDLYGFLFTWQNKLFRAIYPSAEEHVKELFDCGLISELVSLNIFPESSFAGYSMEGVNLIVEHQLIERITYPTEWSFLMLRDAVKTIVHVNMVAKKYGYQTIDAHCYNIVFDKWQPKFVDLGSFVPLEQNPRKKKVSWRAYEEFLYAAWLPLKMWRLGNSYFARKCLTGGVVGRHHHFLNDRRFSLIPEKWAKGVFFILTAYKTVPALPDDVIADFLCHTPIRKKLARLIIWGKHTCWWPFSGINLERFYKKLSMLKKKKGTSMQEAQYVENVCSGRLEEVVALINEYDIKNITEIGGKRGFLAKTILSKTQVEEIVCIDSDENAVNFLYEMIKKNGLNITPVLLDLNFSFGKIAHRLPWERFKSEAVFAMAITPHLILTQNRSLECIFERLALYTRKYVFVEFMSLELYSKIFGCGPTLPDWYTVDWLRNVFENYFDLCFEKQTEKNRILFIGTLKRERLVSSITVDRKLSYAD